MFIGILGHDLRNPLASIVMSAALLLRRGHLDEQDAETAARIIRVSQRMTRMIAQLLDLTRARLGGGLPIERKPTDLREICRNVVEEFDAPIQLEVEGDVTGTWDEDRVAEVLSNLAGNAIEYAAPGTAVIVKAHADGAEVVVEISNQGESDSRGRTSVHLRALPPSEAAREVGNRESRPRPLHRPPDRALARRHARRALGRRHDDLRDAPAAPPAGESRGHEPRTSTPSARRRG